MSSVQTGAAPEGQQARTPTPDEAWKREQWQRLGWEADAAVLLAGEKDLDWHDVETLVARGCDRELALRIVR